MVDLAEIQTAYYMVAATGVLVAAGYYILNMRATQRNMKQTLETRKLQIVTDMVQNLFNEDGMRRYGELMNMEWKDYEDFERKYGSDSNLDNYAKRNTEMMYFSTLGSFLREGLVDAESLYNIGLSVGFIYFWQKFREVIEKQAELYNGADWGKDIELLASEMMRIKRRKDPSYKVPENFLRYVPEKPTP